MITSTVNISFRQHRLNFKGEKLLWKLKLCVTQDVNLQNQTLSIYITYARHYNPQLVYILPHFWSPFLCFQGGFFQKNLSLSTVSVQERVMTACVRTANIYIFFTLEMQWNVTKSTAKKCKFSNIFKFLFTLDKCPNYNISM